MDEHINEAPRMPRSRRRKRSKMQIFKESYLPVIIAGLALVMILVFIIGSISRGSDKRKAEKEASASVSESLANEAKRLDDQAQQLLQQADLLASGYDFEGAIAALDSFEGDMSKYPALNTKRAEYVAALDTMVAWSDPAAIPNLAFNLLVADPVRAYADEDYGSAYRSNFVTIREFSQILQQLYDNGYVLVSLEDFTTCTTGADGHTVCEAKPLLLPVGKKPLLLVQTNVNYYTYMVDGDRDGEADKDGAGFASRLTVGTDGKVTSLMVDAAGNTVTGNYDLVPILNSFIERHPDFSYRGARAILAVSGYDGIFGYRTDAATKAEKGAEYHAGQVAGASAVVDALRAEGYELACYTYGNSSYGTVGAAEIQTELRSWAAEVTPILGQTNILVYAQNSELEDYSGSKFNVLQNAGLRYYLGFGSTGGTVGSDYILLKRLTVTGSQMAHTNQFDNFFDAGTVLEPQRGEVPQ